VFGILRILQHNYCHWDFAYMLNDGCVSSYKFNILRNKYSCRKHKMEFVPMNKFTETRDKSLMIMVANFIHRVYCTLNLCFRYLKLQSAVSNVSIFDTPNFTVLKTNSTEFRPKILTYNCLRLLQEIERVVGKAGSQMHFIKKVPSISKCM
jgi:hypothetical protein